MTWLIYALISLVSFAIYDVLSRVVGVKAKNPRALSAIYNLLFSLYFLPLFFWEPVKFPIWTWQVVGLSIFTFMVWTVFVRYEYYAHQHVEASTLSILLKIAPMISFGLSIIFLKEALTVTKMMGVGLVIVANVILVGQDLKGKKKLSKGLIYAMLVAGSLGLAWTMDKVVAPWYGVVLYCILSTGLPAVINALTPRIKLRELKEEIRVAGKGLFILPIFTVVGYFSMIKALTLGEASRVVPVATATTPIVLLLSMIFLKETKNWQIKIVATIMTGIGIWWLA